MFGKNEKYRNEKLNNALCGWGCFSSSVELPTAMLANDKNYRSVAEKNVGINNLKRGNTIKIFLFSLDVFFSTLHVKYHLV